MNIKDLISKVAITSLVFGNLAFAGDLTQLSGDYVDTLTNTSKTSTESIVDVSQSSDEVIASLKESSKETADVVEQSVKATTEFGWEGITDAFKEAFQFTSEVPEFVIIAYLKAPVVSADFVELYWNESSSGKEGVDDLIKEMRPHQMGSTTGGAMVLASLPIMGATGAVATIGGTATASVGAIGFHAKDELWRSKKILRKIDEFNKSGDMDRYLKDAVVEMQARKKDITEEEAIALLEELANKFIEQENDENYYYNNFTNEFEYRPKNKK